MPMLSFLVENNHLPLFHMTERFIWLNEEKKCINEFTIGYMINPGLNVKNPSDNKWKNVRILYLMKSHNLLLNPN